MVTEKPLITLENIEICRNCRGSGMLAYEHHITQCGVCLGHGRVIVKKEITITLITL